jgi:cell division protein ZapA
MSDDIEVEIFGQVFRVASGDASTAHIQHLAAHVDERMRAIADTSKTMPLTRIAILAALNIADDLLKLREHTDQTAHLVHRKSDHLIALIKKHVDD